MNYEKAVRNLGRFAPMLLKVPHEIRERVFDVRLSMGKPVMLCCGESVYFLKNSGEAVRYFSPDNTEVSREDITEIFLRLCGYSVYSHTDEIRNGFVSADRALRIGIGGTAVLDKGEIKTVRDVTSLCVRIPREKPGCSDELKRAGINLGGGVLLAGAPSSGKTTLLRDLARYIGTAGHRAVVLDERFELLADGFDLGACTDVLQGYPKREGFSHAIRCLSPEYILCDELGENDLEALKAASFAGVSLIASVHAGSAHELKHRPICREILESGVFQTVVLLKGKNEPTGIERIYRAGDLLASDDGADFDARRDSRRVIGIDAAKNA